MFRRGTLLLLICLVALINDEAVAAAAKKVIKDGRIIGGTSVTIDKVPYLVQLRRYGFFICGGTLVDPTHVVTAAHCLKHMNPVEDITVVGGVSTVDEDGEERAVIGSFTHPYYGMGHTYTHDAAVLHLESPLEGKNISPIDLFYDDVPVGEYVQISGWGQTENGTTGPDTLIQTVRVPIIAFEECEEKYSSYSRLSPTMICAALPGKDSCLGDSGGPAVYRNKLAAIVSWGKGCADPNYPGIYTSIRSVNGFVYRAVEASRDEPPKPANRKKLRQCRRKQKKEQMKPKNK